MKILKAGLAGRVLTHSISPEVHQAVFPIVRDRTKSNYTDITYVKLECETENELAFHIKHGTEFGFMGFNITFPYKHNASLLARDSDVLVRQIRSANTLKFGMPFIVSSTDGAGFRFALAKECPHIAPNEYRLVMLGAGGAARAVFRALYDMGWRGMTVAARSLDEARRSFADYPQIVYRTMEEVSRDEGKYFVVQATPVGQRSPGSLIENFQWQPGDIAADLVYNPYHTRFLDRASLNGATAIPGLGMLIEQAALSEHIWMTGREAAETMFTVDQYRSLKRSLSNILTPRWDAFAT